MQRRSLLRGLVAAPLVITTPGLLMPISARVAPRIHLVDWAAPTSPHYLISFTGDLRYAARVGDIFQSPDGTRSWVSVETRTSMLGQEFTLCRYREGFGDAA